MNNKKTLLILSITFLVVIFGAAILYNSLKNETVPEASPSSSSETRPDKNYEPAPDFTIYDKYGNRVSLSDFKGKPVVINFWATWCGPCQSEMPHFEKAFKKYGDDIEFLMINLTDGMRDTPENVQAFIDYFDYTFPVYYDIYYNASDAFGVDPIPVSFFIDKDGNLVSQQIGVLNNTSLEKHISLIK